jgi:L-malate glycosyltransferase
VDSVVKIAFCAPTEIHTLARFQGQDTDCVARGLGSTATTPLIIELLRRGHQVTVFTLSQDLQREGIYRWGLLTIYVGPCRVRHLARNMFSPEIAYLRRVIEDAQPPFVHAHWTYEFALGALRSGVPTVTTIHDLPWNVFRYYRDPHRAVRVLMAYEVAMRCRRFTAVSRDAASHFRRYFRPGADITVIHNGLPGSVFSQESESPVEMVDGCTFATVLQGWSRRKNGTAALKAFALVRHARPDARLTMFGIDYEKDGPAHRWARERRLDSGVTWVGALPYPELLQRLGDEVDVLVHPSLDESFSMAALEGMALRKPVIAGKSTPGVREVLDFGRSGVLVNVRAPRSIADAMLRLAADAGYRRRVATKAYSRASALYRLDRVVPRYEAFYQSLATT